MCYTNEYTFSMTYKKNYTTIFWSVGLLLLLPFSVSFAAMTGGTYSIYADTFSATDDTPSSTGGTYSLRSSSAEAAVGDTSGGTYTLRSGFQAMEQTVLTLSLSTTTPNLGTLSLTDISSTTVSSTISTDSSTGYSLTFDEDGDLRDGAATINDVLDGEVTAGSEEYGIRTIGGGGAHALTDVAIVNGLEVASSNGVVSNEETGIQFRAAIGGSTLAGSYAHTITVTLSANP